MKRGRPTSLRSGMRAVSSGGRGRVGTVPILNRTRSGIMAQKNRFFNLSGASDRPPLAGAGRGLAVPTRGRSNLLLRTEGRRAGGEYLTMLVSPLDGSTEVL